MDPSEKPNNNPSNDTQDWLVWLGQHVLFPLEGAFAPQLKGSVLSQQQMTLLSEMLSTWPRPNILATMRYILADCQRFPTPHDWHRLRPAKEDTPYGKVSESIPETFERLGKTAPNDWARFVMQTTIWGLRTRKTIPGGYSPGGHPSMPEAYDKIIAEGKRRGGPDFELASFAVARDKTLAVRAGVMAYHAERKAQREAERKR